MLTIYNEDKNRIYIIGGTNYNSLDELMQFGKINDDRILYTFHFYEPYIFTHQGAEWTKDKTYITGFPYPYQKNKMPFLPSFAKGTFVERDYEKYSSEATKAYLSERFRNIQTVLQPKCNAVSVYRNGCNHISTKKVS